MHQQHPSLEESLRTELRSWLCGALAGVLALPTESSLYMADQAGLAHLVAHVRQSIDAVGVFVAECREVARSQTLALSTLAFADLAEAMCHLLEEEVTSVQDHVLTFAH